MKLERIGEWVRWPFDSGTTQDWIKPSGILICTASDVNGDKVWRVSIASSVAHAWYSRDFKTESEAAAFAREIMQPTEKV